MNRFKMSIQESDIPVQPNNDQMVQENIREQYIQQLKLENSTFIQEKSIELEYLINTSEEESRKIFMKTLQVEQILLIEHSQGLILVFLMVYLSNFAFQIWGIVLLSEHNPIESLSSSAAPDRFCQITILLYLFYHFCKSIDMYIVSSIGAISN